jgi:putative membrane protein
MKVSAIALAAAGLLVLPGAGISAEGVNDAQIASIVVTANQVDIDAGRLAAARAASAEVKAFARVMVTDHTGVNKPATDLATKLEVTPEDNPTSQSLKADGDAAREGASGVHRASGARQAPAGSAGELTMRAAAGT